MEVGRPPISRALNLAWRTVIAELATALEDFPGAVLVGGSVPVLQFSHAAKPHVGTVDIDVVLNVNPPARFEEETLHNTLTKALFQQDTARPFRWSRVVAVEGRTIEIWVDFLGEGNPALAGLRRIPGEDMYVSVFPEMDLALQSPTDLGIGIPVASAPAFLALKSHALAIRGLAKDAYDINYVLANSGDVSRLAAEIHALSDPRLARAMDRLRGLYASSDAPGPSAYAELWESRESADLGRREAYERVSDLLIAYDSRAVAEGSALQVPN